MKFRGKMTDVVNIRLFAHLMNSLHKFSKVMVLRVMGDKLGFILHEKISGSVSTAGTGGVNANSQTIGVSSGATAWCEIPVDPYFTEFNMEGISANDNEIYMEIAADVFASSLSTLKSSNSVSCLKMKLTKKLVPCLTLEIESQSNNTTLVCTHDIAVHIIPRRNWPEYKCPEPLPFNISLSMPELKLLRLAIERMKNIAPKLVFKMNKEGRLIILVSTYSVQSTVTFSDLMVHNIDGDDDERPLTPIVQGSQEHYSVEVDTKSILHLIPSDGAKPTSMISSMADSRLLHWLFHFGEIQIQYFVPGSAAV